MKAFRVWMMVLLVSMGLLITLIPVFAGQHAHRKSGGTILPANTYFRLRMNQEISSENANIGDRFTAEVVTPVYRGSREVVPGGTIVIGRVSSVVRAKGKGQAGSIAVKFTGIKLPGKPTRLIDGSLTEVVDKDSGKIDEEGRLKEDHHKSAI